MRTNCTNLHYLFTTAIQNTIYSFTASLSERHYLVEIGDTFNPGLSGGERKRLSIACELIGNPNILLLDVSLISKHPSASFRHAPRSHFRPQYTIHNAYFQEPTSGLDAGLALRIMQELVTWCVKEKKILLTTIHQPSSQIFHMFEDLIFLCDGKMAFRGKSDEVVEHFSSIGIECEEGWNPADFVCKCSSIVH